MGIGTAPPQSFKNYFLTIRKGNTHIRKGRYDIAL